MNSLVKNFSKLSILRTPSINIAKRNFSNNNFKDKESAEEKIFFDKNESNFYIVKTHKIRIKL